MGSEIGFVEGAMTCAGIKVGVLDAGANPNLTAAIGFGYLITRVKPSSNTPRITTPITVRFRTFNKRFTRVG